MRAERDASFGPMPGKVILWVFGYSWRRCFVSSGLVHDLKIKLVPDFWVDSGETRAMDLLKADQSNRAAVKLARLEARAA